MTKKKENWIDKISVKWLLIGFGFTIIMVFYGMYLNSTYYLCGQHPEKCVCEETVKCSQDKYGKIWVYGHEQAVNSIGIFKKCKNSLNVGQQEVYTKLRLKTQSELLIDGCNNNPRDDTDCKCLEYKTTKILDSAIIDVEFINTPFGNFNYTFNLSGRFDTEVYIQLTDQYRYNVSTYYNSVFNEFWEYKIINISEEKWIDYSLNCLKSHPKTECEKGNNNYIQYSYKKRGEQFEDCYEVPDFCYEGNTYCDGIDSSKKLLILHNESCNDYKISNPICIPKNQCELGNLDWVEEICYFNATSDKLCLSKEQQIYTDVHDYIGHKTICREKTKEELKSSEKLINYSGYGRIIISRTDNSIISNLSINPLPTQLETKLKSQRFSTTENITLNKYGCVFLGVSERGLNQWDCQNTTAQDTTPPTINISISLTDNTYLESITFSTNSTGAYSNGSFTNKYGCKFIGISGNGLSRWNCRNTTKILSRDRILNWSVAVGVENNDPQNSTLINVNDGAKVINEKESTYSRWNGTLATDTVVSDGNYLSCGKNNILTSKDKQYISQIINECKNLSQYYGYVAIANRNYLEIQQDVKDWISLNYSVGIFFDLVDNTTYIEKDDCYETEYYLEEEKMKELFDLIHPNKIYLNSYKPYEDTINVKAIREMGFTPPCESK